MSNLERELILWLQTKLNNSSNRPLIIGLNGPQGCGKTTISKKLKTSFSLFSISIDDFYLKKSDQEKLSAQYKNNPYLKYRGYPGTHDIALGVQTLKSFKHQSYPIQIPLYNKSLFNGLGDRTNFETLNQPVDIVILEGWMLGFKPIENLKDQHLAIVDKLLAPYKLWYEFIDYWISLNAPDIDTIVNWRVEAEKTMTKQQAREYAELFRSAYHHYSKPFRNSLSKNDLVLDLNSNREI